MYTYFKASFKCMWLLKDAVYYYRYSDAKGMELFSYGEWLGSQVPCNYNKSISECLNSLRVVLSGASIGVVDIRQLSDEEAVKVAISLELES